MQISYKGYTIIPIYHILEDVSLRLMHAYERLSNFPTLPVLRNNTALNLLIILQGFKPAAHSVAKISLV